MSAAIPAMWQSAPRQHPIIARLFFLVLIVRAACDPLFDLVKPEAGAGMGLGAAVNAFMLLVAGIYLLRRPLETTRVVAPMWLPFIAAALVSTIGAPLFTNAARLFLVQLSYCALFAIPFYLVRSDADVRRCLRAILWSSVLPVGIGLLQLALQGGFRGGEVYRLKSTFTHPNIFAFYLVLMMSVILYLQKAAGPPPGAALRRGLWLYMVPLLALLVCTGTRSAWAGALLVFGIYGVFFQRRFLLYALVVPALLLLDPAVRERLADLGSNNQSPAAGHLNSYAWRLLLWKSGLDWMDSSQALAGYGLDSFKFYSPRFFPLEGQDNWDPHNVYVQLFFETGAIGLAAYGWLFWRLLRTLWWGLERDRAGTTVLIAVVLANLAACWSDNMLYYLSYNWYFWFFTGTACAALGQEIRRGKREAPCATTTA